MFTKRESVLLELMFTIVAAHWLRSGAKATAVSQVFQDEIRTAFAECVRLGVFAPSDEEAIASMFAMITGEDWSTFVASDECPLAPQRTVELAS
ncbi:MAG: hypothetical protein WBD37_11470 [Anderseniella sp.]